MRLTKLTFVPREEGFVGKKRTHISYAISPEYSMRLHSVLPIMCNFRGQCLRILYGVAEFIHETVEFSFAQQSFYQICAALVFSSMALRCRHCRKTCVLRRLLYLVAARAAAASRGCVEAGPRGARTDRQRRALSQPAMRRAMADV